MKLPSFLKIIVRVFVLICIILITPASVWAAPFSQNDDPFSQCSEGIQLFNENRYSEALPLLEFGFTNRTDAAITSPDDFGLCALILGYLYDISGRNDEALNVYLVSFELFTESNNTNLQGKVLNNIGAIFTEKGQYTKALEYYDLALKARREVEDLQGESNTLNNIGFVHEAQSQHEKALDYYQQALDISRQIGDRKGESDTLNNIGIVHKAQGQYIKALEFYNLALAISKEIKDQIGEGITLNSIGELYAAQGHYSMGLEYYDRALVIVHDAGDQAGEGAILQNMGSAYVDLGQYANALQYYKKALNIVQRVGARPSEAAILINIGSVYSKQGQYARSLEYYEQALVIYQKIGNQAGEGVSLSKIGSIYYSQGLYSKAMEYHEQALDIRQKIGDRAGEGSSLNKIGMVYEAQGQYSEAMPYYERTLAIYQEINDKDDESAALNNIASVLQEQGQYDAALEYYNRSLSISREIENREGEGTTLSNIGNVYKDQGYYDSAIEYYKHALVIHEEIGNQLMVGITQINMGDAYEAQGANNRALEYYENAIDIFETIRAVAGTESARSSFIEKYYYLYDRTISLLVKENQAERAFLLTERGRARSFLDSLATGFVELGNIEAVKLYTQEQEAYVVSQNAQEALARAKAQTTPDEQLIADLEIQLVQVENDYQTALNSISERKDYLNQLIPGRSEVLDFTQSQGLLDDQTTLLSFWVLDNQFLAFILTNDTFNVLAIPVSRTDLYANIKAFREFSNTGDSHPEGATKLYHDLIEPLKIYLATPNLVIVLHGELHYLPFAALTDGKHYLMDEYSITYLPSVSAWPYIKQNTGKINTNPLIIGNPAINNTELQPLPFAEKEVQVIANLYQINPLTGNAATESTVRNQVGEAGVLHLAAHGAYNTVNPLYSAIYLSSDDQNDGVLETHEIYGLQLKKTDLVVLSACETQLGELSRGDELVGLTRAFLFAGTPSVISSLWSVDDKATQLLMEKFYTYWRSGMGKAEALRQAQMDVREQYPNPYFWAGFVLNGDGGTTILKDQPVETKPDSPSIPNCGTGLSPIVLVMGGVWFSRRRRR